MSKENEYDGLAKRCLTPFDKLRANDFMVEGD
jgi:hypothetical protein